MSSLSDGATAGSKSNDDLSTTAGGLSPIQRRLLAQQLIEDAARHTTFDPQLVPIMSAPRNAALPLSFAQQRLWFLYLLNPGSSAYNIPTIYYMVGELDVDALQRSINEIVRRHEVLRTNFTSFDGQPIQVIAPSQPLTIEIVDLQGASANQKEAEVQQRAMQEAHFLFDLTRWPLMRAILLRLAPQEYVLLLTMHHIVFDGWSLAVFERELAALYPAFSAHMPSPLPELRIQYADFAAWQRECLQGQVLKSQLAYWKQQLQGALPALELPTDYARQAVQSLRGARQTLMLPGDLVDRLKALSLQEGCTLFMTLLAAFKVLVHRLTGQDDIAVGCPIAGRSRHETEDLIGFFVNTLVLRTNLSSAPSFRELLKQTRGVTLEAYAHQELPFEKLVEELQPERDPNHNPLFDVMFNFVNTPPISLDLPGVQITYGELPELESKFAMTLYVRESGNGLDLQLVYRRELFSAERMALLLSQYRYLLDQILAAPDQSIRSYSLITLESRHVLPDPKVALAEPRHKSVPEWVIDQLDRAGDRPAMCKGKRTWTYRELVESMQCIARALRARGLESGDRVAVSGPRSFGLVAGMLGVLQSGGVLINLDRRLPAARQELTVREGGAKFVLYVGDWQAEDQWLRALSALSVIGVDPDEGRLRGSGKPDSSNAVNLPQIRPDDPAYIFFTSGTTGVPKGVLGCHKGLSHFLNWQRERFAIQAEDRCAQLTTLSFDVVLRDILLPLVSGATLYLPDALEDVATGQILSWLDHERISVVHTVPTLACAWLRDVPPGLALRKLRWIFFAGEPLPEALVRRWRETFPESGSMVNLYGPTETTLAKCFFVVPPTILPGIQPIGWPLPETQALLLAGDGKPCGIGEPGEIAVRTPFRSLGYVNAPEENQRRFRKNPFREDERDLLYYTGDRGRFRLDGSLEILGRLDDQVKVRGVRVEPNEIAATLAMHPAVQACVVVGSKDQEGDTALVAYVVEAPPARVQPDELRIYLEKLLPPALIPSTFVLLDALPLTSNGKVDRRALPSRGATPPVEREDAMPRTPVEKALARIWIQVLGLQQVGIHDNFFELGGDSLLILQVIAKARQAGIHLTARQILGQRTIARLAAQASLVASFSAEQVAVTGSAPILPGQFWILDMEHGDLNHWNSAQLLEPRQHLDANLLERVIRELLLHHDALRVRVVREGSTWRQHIAASEEKTPFAHIDLSVLPPAERVPALEAMAAQLQTTLNLSEGPILRVALFELGEAQRLLIIVHHLAIDGISWDILLEDLEKAYQQISRGQRMELPAKTTSIKEWGERLALYRNLPAVQEELPYWLAERWKQAPRLPMDYPEGRARDTMDTGAYVWAALSAEETQALQEMARTVDISMNEVLLTALLLTLTKWTGKTCLPIHVAHHGREGPFEDVDLSRTVGFLATGYSALLDVGKASSPRDALKLVKKELESIPNRGFGFGLLRYGDPCTYEKMRVLEPELAFDYVGQFSTETQLFKQAAESKGPAMSPQAKRYYLLFVDMGIANGQLRTRWGYGERIYRRATIEHLAREFEETLRSFVAHRPSSEKP